MALQFPEGLRPLFSRLAVSTVEVSPANSGGDIGSGVIITRSGLILTATHAIEGGASIRVRRFRLHKKKWRLVRTGSMTADVVAADRKTDIAILQVREPPPDLSAATLGTSWQLAVGSPAFHIGMTDVYKLGAGHVISFGIEEGVPEIRIGIPHGSGSSGGPVFDPDGKIIGILARGDYDEFLPPVARVVPIDVAKSSVLDPYLLGIIDATKNRR